MKLKPFPRLVLIVLVVGGLIYFVKRAHQLGFFDSGTPAVQNVQQAAPAPGTATAPPVAAPAPAATTEPPRDTTVAPAPAPAVAPEPAAAESNAPAQTNPGLEKLLNSGARK